MAFGFVILLITGVFTGLMLAIIGLLTAAENKLVKTGPVKITTNDDDTTKAPADSTLAIVTMAAIHQNLP